MEMAVLVLVSLSGLLFLMVVTLLGLFVIMSFFFSVLMAFLLMIMVLFRLGTLGLDSNIFSIRVYAVPMETRISIVQ